MVSLKSDDCLALRIVGGLEMVDDLCMRGLRFFIYVFRKCVEEVKTQFAFDEYDVVSDFSKFFFYFGWVFRSFVKVERKCDREFSSF